MVLVPLDKQNKTKQNLEPNLTPYTKINKMNHRLKCNIYYLTFRRKSLVKCFLAYKQNHDF